MAPAVVDELRSLLGAGGYLDAAADIEPFLVDHRRRYRGDAPLVALPESTARVSALLRRCAELGVGVVPHGGNTSYCGAATPRPGGCDIVVSLRRMNRIRAVDPAGNSVTVEAGCLLHEVQAAAESVGRLFPMSLGSEGSCTIGGNLATNAGGTAVLRYGMMRDLVLGLEVVLPDGRVLDQLRALRKDNTGYDLKHLFIGAEGTLGIVTAACLKLFPRPRGHVTAFVALADPAAALRLLDRLRAELGDAVTTFELVPRLALELACRHVPGCSDPFDAAAPWYVLLEVSLPPAAAGLSAALEARLAADLEAGEIENAVVAASLAQREGLWRLRESIPEAQSREGASLKHDVSVESHALPAFIEAGRALLGRLVPGSRLVAYGHLGDGNLHFNLSVPAGGDEAAFLARAADIRRAVHDLVASHRGSFSAEHGIGQDKVAELERYEDPVALDLMRGIKRLLDPRGIMNPGKVLRDPEDSR
jgi:D-lactate dehydrogenase (cytochrome)